jgi:hypothetical protein
LAKRKWFGQAARGDEHGSCMRVLEFMAPFGRFDGPRGFGATKFTVLNRGGNSFNLDLV